MYEKVPFILVSNSLSELKKVVDTGNLDLDEIKSKFLLFNSSTNSNILTFEHTVINDEPQIIITAVDPDGQLSESFRSFRDEQNTSGKLPTFFMLYGIGSDLENSSRVIETPLLGIDFSIDKGRVYTLTFGPNTEATKSLLEVGKYSTTPTPRIAEAEGVSDSLIDYTFVGQGDNINSSFDNCNASFKVITKLPNL